MRTRPVLSPGRSRWLVIAPLLLLAPGALAQRAAVLPLDGPAALVPTLEAGIVDALEGEGLRDVLDPLEARHRLCRAPVVTEAISSAEQDLTASLESTLHMKQAPAAGAARRAVSRLQTAAARFCASNVLARAHAAQAFALLLQPRDEAGAREAFHAAVRVDPAFTPDPVWMTSRAQSLFTEGQVSRAAPQPPLPVEAQQAAWQLEVSRLVWVAVRQLAVEQVLLQAVLVDAQGKQLARVDATSTSQQALPEVVQLIRRLLGPATSAPRAAAVPKAATEATIASRPGHEPLPSPGTFAGPWYRRWWIWAVAGAVVLTAAGVTVGVLVADGEAPSPRPIDIEFRF